jgi:hypothetical protein
MDDRTERLRDLFVETTGGETVTERQEPGPGSLADDGPDEAAVRAVIDSLRERHGLATDLDDEALVRVARGYFDGEDDSALAAALGVDERAVLRARAALHLIDDRDRDREGPVAVDRVRALLREGRDPAAALDDADPAALERARVVAAAEIEIRRAGGRFRDEFAALLSDADLGDRLAESAREDGLREATADLETDVSF